MALSTCLSEQELEVFDLQNQTRLVKDNSTHQASALQSDQVPRKLPEPLKKCRWLLDLGRDTRRQVPFAAVKPALAAKPAVLETNQSLYDTSLDKSLTHAERCASALRNPDDFWADQARALLNWEVPFSTVSRGSFGGGDVRYFDGGRLNASTNYVDRWANLDPTRPAIIFESDDPTLNYSLDYASLLQQVSKLAWVLRDLGVRRGDVVAVYMPTCPEAYITALACTRIGALHSCVFAGFSADALRDRILDASCKVLVTADETIRGPKRINLKHIVDAALAQCPRVQTCLVHQRAADAPLEQLQAPRDRSWRSEMLKWPPYFVPEIMDSESPLFLLYTSGSTGKPKGLMHTTAGYLLGAALTCRLVFDLQQKDRFFCGGDIGWITGHTYGLYGPLLLGATIVITEGVPTYPNPSRYWSVIDRNQVKQPYTAPTVLRLLRKQGEEHLTGRLDSLKYIGCVGEPLAPNVFSWCRDVVGRGRIQVLDTYFQTETGAHILSPLAGITDTKPGSCCLPFPGMDLCILDPVTGQEAPPNEPANGVLAVKRPWPSLARTVWGAHSRYRDVYLDAYPGYYFTGDGAERDADGYYWIKGRVDDVINVSGHRLSTAEIEAALLEHAHVAEVAVVSVPDDLAGQAIETFVTLKGDDLPDAAAVLTQHVRARIGAFAAPRAVIVTPDLPKTRSGKIMRRILRKILAGEYEELGDTTTLSDPSVPGQIIDVVKAQRGY